MGMKKRKPPKTWVTPAGSASRLCLDILKQPHTLIAGTTGSGKSVLMNTIIYTALYSTPNDCRLLLIDTKLTEFGLYAKLPHTLAYCTTPNQAISTLAWALRETRRRGERAAADGLKQSKESNIYILIDELGDLIFTDRAAVNILAQIAMIGRAANVHIIAGTQCPNRRTLSAELAANCPARVGLRCRDKIESRQIINAPDCVNLPMHGKGIYIAPQFARPQPVDIPMTPDMELKSRVKLWENQPYRQ